MPSSYIENPKNISMPLTFERLSWNAPREFVSGMRPAREIMFGEQDVVDAGDRRLVSLLELLFGEPHELVELRVYLKCHGVFCFF